MTTSEKTGRPTAEHGGHDRYRSLSIALHWLMLLLIAAVYACIELRGNFPKGSYIREGLKTWHFMLGLSVLIFLVVRVAARLTGTVPRIEPAPSKVQRVGDRHAHRAYALTVCMPLMGCLTLSAEGTPVPFFGLHLPPLTGESKSVADWAKEIHETGGTVFYVLIGLHAAAALFHHYVVRDNTLRRMLPSRHWHFALTKRRLS